MEINIYRKMDIMYFQAWFSHHSFTSFDVLCNEIQKQFYLKF